MNNKISYMWGRLKAEETSNKQEGKVHVGMTDREGRPGGRR